jgi:hypothetical protein
MARPSVMSADAGAVLAVTQHWRIDERCKRQRTLGGTLSFRQTAQFIEAGDSDNLAVREGVEQNPDVRRAGALPPGASLVDRSESARHRSTRAAALGAPL